MGIICNNYDDEYNKINIATTTNKSIILVTMMSTQSGDNVTTSYC